MKLKAKINNDRKLILNWDLINSYLQGFKPDTWFDITITRKTKKVSDPLRNYYFGGVLPDFMKELGYEPDEVDQFHLQLKARYFNVEPDERGILRNVPHVFNKKDTKLDVPKQVEFVEWVKRLAAKYGVYISDPNE